MCHTIVSVLGVWKLHDYFALRGTQRAIKH